MNNAFPYLSVPTEARWREVMAGHPPLSIDPHYHTTLRIHPDSRIASAGSCFAQRIAQALKAANYNYMMLENGSPFQTPDERLHQGFGLYSARYGNVYTALQLLQLLRRAFGRFEPVEPLWRLPNGNWVDPFRPAMQPGGFASESECLWDRQAHLAAVRKMFEEVDIFIFTLGLTEAWQSKVDGAVFPACPGSSLGGEYDPHRHVFHNFGVAEVSADLDTFLAELREINPTAQVMLTVSPVPLLATFEARHVLQATVYSKSVLRVVAEEAVRKHPHVHYFAAYEIVNHTGDSKTYFLDDLRNVSNDAVKHVIQCFHRQFTGADLRSATDHLAAPNTNVDAKTERDPLCDEALVMEALANQVKESRGSHGN